MTKPDAGPEGASAKGVDPQSAGTRGAGAEWARAVVEGVPPIDADPADVDAKARNLKASGSPSEGQTAKEGRSTNDAVPVSSAPEQRAAATPNPQPTQTSTGAKQAPPKRHPGQPMADPKTQTDKPAAADNKSSAPPPPPPPPPKAKQADAHTADAKVADPNPPGPSDNPKATETPAKVQDDNPHPQQPQGPDPADPSFAAQQPQGSDPSNPSFAATQGVAENSQQPEGLPESVESLVVDLERVTGERDAYLDSSRRIQAEFENYRKQVAQRETTARERANEGFVKELLPVLDACDSAMANGSEDVAIMRNTLFDAMTKQGLERIEPTDAPFDPEFHEAVMHEEGDGSTGAVVVEVMRAGYSWNGRVVRPAMVKVRG